uniref:Sidoreflexin n=1 Tax=Mucochytrium quahogii TaxID=96639 RepID=A0A7S2RBJ1_9STRA|mmetsp:Transcript_18203/g.29589  ORF Transcript_18203/g.29589 Transcript_18203/m.29589 type:complete len:317 (+) Transcript_18203:231-1181(+)|eukprot:CAMPEP_0203777798 /NCGR_PEP_ID=MMETSP0099_2-20121227/7601_1 /ASSEMBLY_ACC=CAM_ASM_000209 /TAXON_ID=96639 /ORGANISM=" , Strain NY0313808BC1" /LENGTH=316 /DNA_ID=CAMNT_0050677155 /DNA_START=160 /DNA_END=1110 /DNA_ORIENTATION=+
MKEFTLDGSKFDLSTYSGRFENALDVVDPRIILASDADIAESRLKLEEFKAGKRTESDESLWHAKKILDGATNPGTGDTILPPFRMAAFVPFNIPIVAGMLNTTTVAGTVFWQWFNQSFNSATNYQNRSGSDMSTGQIAKSYGIAVGLSCGLALSFRWLGMNGPQLFKRISQIPFVVPYIAVGGAGAANVYFSRQPEIENGVMVKDKHGNDVGVSKVAGKQGVMMTIASRSLGLPIPVLILPTAIMACVPKTLPKRTLMLAELLVITGSLYIGLPAALAMFPQQMEMDATSLEPEFHDLIDKDGNPITKLYSNKGM